MMIGLPVDGAEQARVAEPSTTTGGARATRRRSSEHKFDAKVASRRLLGQRSLAALVLADAFALGVALVGGQLIGDAVDGHSLSRASAAVTYLPIYMVTMACYGLYRRGRRRLVGSSFPDVSHLVHSMIVASLVTFAVSGEANRLIDSPRVGRLTAVAATLLALVGIPLARALARWAIGRAGTIGGSRVLVVGSGVVAAQVVSRLQSLGDIRLVGWVDDNLFTDDSGAAKLGNQLRSLDDLPHVVRTWDVDHVVVAFSPAGGSTLAALLRDLSAEVRISIVPRLFDLLSVRSHVDDLRGLPIIDVAPPALGTADRFAKRALDLIGSSIGLLLLSPLLLAVTVAIEATSRGPVLFPQERTGRGGRSFKIYKFRTMRDSAEADKAGLDSDVAGPLFKAHSDPRVTRIGRLLRQTSLDEIPQLINVFKGQMSLVGPRPFVPEESEMIQGWAAKRLEVRPGMTGLWQVSGRSDLPFEELCRLDYSYVASWSLWWDIHILWQTPSAVLRRHGAY